MRTDDNTEPGWGCCLRDATEGWGARGPKVLVRAGLGWSAEESRVIGGGAET